MLVDWAVIGLCFGVCDKFLYLSITYFKSADTWALVQYKDAILQV